MIIILRQRHTIAIDLSLFIFLASYLARSKDFMNIFDIFPR